MVEMVFNDDPQTKQAKEEFFNKLSGFLNMEFENGNFSKEKAQTVYNSNAAEIDRQMSWFLDTQSDFTPDELEKIGAFAMFHGSSKFADSVLKKVQDRQNKITTSENLNTENNEKANSPEPAGHSLLDSEIPLINQPSYNVLKEYQSLKNTPELTPEERNRMEYIQEQAEQILNSADSQNIDPENAVALRDYLDISNSSSPDETAKERNAKLETTVDEQLKIYDLQNQSTLFAYTSLTPEQLEANRKQWMQIGQQVKPEIVTESIKPLLASLPQEDAQKLNREIYGNLLTITLEDLKIAAPGADGKDQYTKFLSENITEFQTYVNAEYLKQETAAFCEKNKIDAQKMEKILNEDDENNLSDEDKKLKKLFEEHVGAPVTEFPDFKGPYKNAEALKNAVISANAAMLSRQTTLSSRAARLANAPEISKSVTRANNSFAQKHPGYYMAFNVAKTFAANLAKNFVKTAAIGAVFGPVGLGAYSAYKTYKAIKKSKNQFSEETGGGWKDWCKHMTKKENRQELLTLSGQIIGSAISVGFGVGSEFLDYANAVNGASAAVNLTAIRRTAQTAASLTIGVTKWAAAKSNQKDALKGLSKILRENVAPGKISDDSLEALIKIKDPQKFQQALANIAPDLSPEAKAQISDFAAKYQKENPMTAGLSSITGAVVGLALHEAAESETYKHFVGGITGAAITGSAGSELGSIAAAPGEVMGKVMEEQQLSEQLHHDIAQQLWNVPGADDNRELAANANPAGLNGLLKEIGVISQDDKHFYVSRELKDIMNRDDLTAEQKIQIQEFADNRDGNIKAMQDWNAAHAHVQHTAETETKSAPAAETVAKTAETPKESETKTGFHYETKDGKKVELKLDGSEEQTNETKVQEELKKAKFKVSVTRGEARGTEAEVEATNAVTAASILLKNQGVNMDENYHATVHATNEETGEDSKVKIKNTDGYKKITLKGDDIKQTMELDKETGITSTKVTQDFDGDGKKDTLKSFTTAKGQTVTYADMSGGKEHDTLTIKNPDGTKQTLTAEEAKERGYSLKSIYKGYEKAAEKEGVGIGDSKYSTILQKSRGRE